ncbi:MAG TPA: hypothetical protein QF564_08675 [Pirellulaceae bacterium]|jgi:hypothetical protein|nr:hypothetical protein [Pirellulaceae bacterium]
MPRYTLLLFCLLAVWTAPCLGVIILEKDSAEAIKGFLVSQNDQRVIVDELLPNGETRQRVVPRSTIDVMIISVVPDRLAALQPDQPQSYRDYADELSEKREDPEARNAAIRLYLLAAHLDPKGQGRSSLLSMAGLARSPNEERKFRAMVYLLDPAHDRGELKPPSLTASPEIKLTRSQRSMMLTAIRALRNDNRREALNFSARPLFQEIFNRYSSILTLDEFSAAAAQRDEQIPASLLRKLISMELLVLDLPLKNRPSTGDVRWSTILMTGQDTPVTPLSLETITEFDPNENVFKNNRWSVPEDR